MEVVKAKNKSELMDILLELDSEIDEIYINKRPSADIVVGILNNAPKIKTIYCPPSLFDQTSQKVVDALNNVEIKLKAHDVNRGRPKKYEKDLINNIKADAEAGKPIKHIAEKYEIPLRTAYFYINGS
ncbi:MAG: DUF1699 domain-containing protein [Candidatus Diapherotrites archaeon]|nr:DUF1699 domain-containing protein [Candidatus Diapherotrites archaeon]